MKASNILAALLLGMAGGMGQSFPSKLHGIAPGSHGGTTTFRTKSGGRMQGFRQKKVRNIKGRSR